MLTGIDFAQIVSKRKSKKQLPALKEQIYNLQKASWDANLPVIVVLEGWETVRKGSLARALTEPLDPRGFVYHTIRSPLAHEKSRPWMWRFWLKIPERGQWAIFDQSWYRRVLVEPYQDKLSERDLRRAYRDINDFERTLSDDGALILKYFFHTTKRQFKLNAERATQKTEANPGKLVYSKSLARRYDQLLESYEVALRHTQQDWAPWVVIPADDKRTARYSLLKSIVTRLQQHLGFEFEPKRAETKPAAPETRPEAAKETNAGPDLADLPASNSGEEIPAAAIQSLDSENLSTNLTSPQSEADVAEESLTASQQSLTGEPQEPDENATEAAPAPSGDEPP